MRSYAVGEWRVLREVRVPNALPFFFTSLKVAASLAVIAAIVSEYFGGEQGTLGTIITQSAGLSRYDRAWAAVFAACVLGIALYLLVTLIDGSRSVAPACAARAEWKRRRGRGSHRGEDTHAKKATTRTDRMGAAAALVVGACGGDADDDAAGSEDGGGTEEEAARRPDAGLAAAAVVRAGAVRRLLRGRARASTRTRDSTSRSSKAASTSSRRPSWPPARSTSRSRGCPRRSRP